MCLSRGSHSSAVATRFGDRLGRVGDARPGARPAGPGTRPTACTAAATSSASVLAKYR